MAEDVQITIGATLGNLLSSVEQAKTSIASLAEIGLAGFGLDQLKDLVQSMADLGEQTQRTAAILGTSASEVQKLAFMSEVTGGDSQRLTLAMERLQVGLQRATVPTSIQAQALSAMGLSARQLLAVPIPEQLALIADAMKRLHDEGINPTSLALDLMGRGAASIIPELLQGRAGMDDLGVAASQAGAIVSDTTTRALANLDERLKTMKASFTALAETIVAQFATALSTSIGSMTAWVANASAVISAGHLWEALLENLKFAVLDFANKVMAAGFIIKDFLTLNWGAIQSDWNAGLAGMDRILEDHLRAQGLLLLKSKLQLQQDMASVPALTTPSLNLGAAQAAKNELKIADDKYAELKIREDAAVKTYQITEAERTEVLKAALKVRMDAEIKAHVDRGVAEAKYNKDLAELDAQTTEKIIADWKKVADQFASDFSSALDQVLTKQKSFSAAMGAMFGKMIEQMIADVVKLIAEYVILNAAIGAGLGGPGAAPVTMKGLAGTAFPLLGGILGGGGAVGGAQAAATTANTAAVTALTAAVTGHVAATATQTAVTATNTAATFEGAAVTTLHTAVVAPNTVATVANTGATIANTFAEKFGAAFAAFGLAEGAWKIPSFQTGGTPSFTGLAMLHAGEMVIPAGPAEAIRTGAAGVGGAPSVNLSISAIDGPSFANWLRSGGGNQISRYITQAWQNNPSNRPGYTQ